MSFGKRLLEVRKEKGLSQEDIAKHLNTKAPVIGRYEREEMKPSIDVAVKLAAFLEVSLDYLSGYSDVLIDTKTLKRVTDIQLLDQEDQNHIFYTLDNLIKAAKLKNI